MLFLGVLIGIYYVSDKKIHNFMGFLFFIVPILLCAGNIGFLSFLKQYQVNYEIININLSYFYQCFMAAMLLFGVIIFSKNAKNQGTNKKIDISLNIYVFHWPILLSLACYILIKSYDFYQNSHIAAFLAAFVGIVTTICLSILVNKLVSDRWEHIVKKMIESVLI